MHGINFLISFTVITFLFAAISRFSPAARIAWAERLARRGGNSATIHGRKFLLGFYLGKASVGSSYGAAGSLVVLLVWVHYSAQILLLGADFTHVYTTERGERRDAHVVHNQRELIRSGERSPA